MRQAIHDQGMRREQHIHPSLVRPQVLWKRKDEGTMEKSFFTLAIQNLRAVGQELVIHSRDWQTRDVPGQRVVLDVLQLQLVSQVHAE